MLCPNKQRYFEPFVCLDLVSFRMLAVILVSDCFQLAAPSERDSHVLYCGFGWVLKLASRWAKMENGAGYIKAKYNTQARC